VARDSLLVRAHPGAGCGTARAHELIRRKAVIKIMRFAVVLAILAVATPLMADHLAESTSLLCTAVQATVCESSGECSTKPPWNFNIPQFVVVDLEQKLLSTTVASGENRVTAIKHVERESGMIFLHGSQMGRAFCAAVNEATGMMSFAVASDGKGVVIFGACTPMPVSK
jgi:hypothetical protein